MGTLDRPAPPASSLPGTPHAWRWGIGLGVVALGVLAYLTRGWIGPRGQALLGIGCFFGIVAAFSANLRAVNWRTIGWGFALQLLLGLFVIKFEIFGVRPGYQLFSVLAAVFREFLAFTMKGSRFVFGDLADKYFAFQALPTVIFVASFFTVLYYFGILQVLVRLMARVMSYLMRTSGAETLSVSANVFMGQTEAPLIVKPYVAGMTQSELLTLMVGGMAHISGSLMAVYISMGADPVGILATSVMAAPCSLYLSKLFLPELGRPETLGVVKVTVEEPHANVIDAASAGAADGMRLAINIAAMLIAFLAFIAMADFLLDYVGQGFGQPPQWLSLKRIFSWVFSPVAFLMGVDAPDIPRVADLLGTKLVANEFVAYMDYQKMAPHVPTHIAALGGAAYANYLEVGNVLSPRSQILATYALTGFANFASIGIQIGGIGAIAPSRRQDLARLGGRALFVGFLVTLINASIAGLLLD